MKIKKIPMRRCVITKEQLPKRELIRIVRTPDGKVIIDLKGKQNGRGAYLKKELKVIEKAHQSKIIDKHLELKVPKEVYEELREMIK